MAKPIETAREVLEEIPRDYVYATRRGNAKFFFSPVSHVIGEMLVTSPVQLEKRAVAAQKWQRWYQEAGTPLRFPWPEKYLSMDPDRVAYELREAVAKVEETYKLWDLYPRQAMRNAELRGGKLTAKVASKSPGRGEKNPHNVGIESVYLNQDGSPDLISLGCSCDQSFWTAIKGHYDSKIECMHVAALMDYFWESVKNPNSRSAPAKVKGRPFRGEIFNPFRFADNWNVRGGKYFAKDKKFASLVWDIIMAKYGGKEGHYSINRRALDIPWFVSPSFGSMIEQGIVTREVISQKRKRRKVSRVQAEDEKNLFDQARSVLGRHGYKRLEARCIEFGEPALHYEHGGNSVNLVFSQEHPPYYVVRERPTGPINPFHREEQKDPFSFLGEKNLRLYDDRTMRETEASVQMFSAIRLPETGMRYAKSSFVSVPKGIKKGTREKIKETFGERAEQKMKHARVFY